VHENVFKIHPQRDIRGYIIWIPILEKDTFDSAIQSAKVLKDYRIKHYYDNNKAVGKTIADCVGWAGNIAWDVYLFYLPLVKWTETPPKPKYWMHQLTDDWASKDKYRTGNELKTELSVSMGKLLIS